MKVRIEIVPTIATVVERLQKPSSWDPFKCTTECAAVGVATTVTFVDVGVIFTNAGQGWLGRLLAKV